MASLRLEWGNIAAVGEFGAKSESLGETKTEHQTAHDAALATPVTDGAPLIRARPCDPRIQRVIRIVEDSPFPAPTSAELAAAVGLSEFHFSRLFHAVVGKPVGVYVRDMCLGQAAFRLKASDTPIHDLYADYGYGSQAAFTRAFTSRFGEPPAAFRERVRAAASSLPPPPQLDVRIQRRASQDVLLRRYTGPAAARADAWCVFSASVEADGLGQGRWFGLTHDDPAVCRPDELRFDVGFAPMRRSSFFAAPASYERYRTTAGVYGTVTFVGPYDQVRDAYAALLRGWLQRQTRYVIAGEPLIESFAASPPTARSAVCELEVSVKLGSRGQTVEWFEGAEQRALAAREWRAVVSATIDRQR